MGVYLPNMEMPTSCQNCRFCDGQADTDYGVCAWCDVDGNARDAYTMQDCPLVPVPPHGRLIDAAELAKVMAEGIAPSTKDGGFQHPFDIFRALSAAPTIIPPSGGKEDE